MALQRGHFADLGYPVTPMLAHMLWRGRSMGQIFDHRETEMGLCQLARTVSESVEERWRDGVGSLPDLGYPVTPMLCTHGPRDRFWIFDT